MRRSSNFFVDCLLQTLLPLALVHGFGSDVRRSCKNGADRVILPHSWRPQNRCLMACWNSGGL